MRRGTRGAREAPFALTRARWWQAAGPDGGPCSECSGGKYKAIDGSCACKVCGDASEPTDNRTWCRCLDPHALFLEERCVCVPGFTQASGSGGPRCTPCSAKTFKGWSGNAACTPCPPYSNMPSETVGSTSSEDCQCNAGYTLMANKAACSRCPAGKYKERQGYQACRLCAAGTYSPVSAASSASTCLACPSRSHSPAGSQDVAACACASLPR